MSWRDRLITIDGESYYAGKFRNALFLLRTDALEFGRNNEVHEYPLAALPWVEDSGPAKNQFQLSVFVTGENFDIERDKLIAAINEPGSGALQLPFYGAMQVSIIKPRVTHRTKKGGRAEFSFTCVVGSDFPQPTITEITEEETKNAADETLVQAVEDFSSSFDVLGQAADAVQAVTDEIAATMAAVDDAIGNVTGPIADLIRSPAEMAGAIVGGVNRIRITIGEPGRALNIYKSLFNAGSNGSYSTATASQKKTVGNIQALQHLVQRAAMAEAANVTASMQYLTSDDALRDAGDIATAIEAHASSESVVDGSPISDEVYAALTTLQATVMIDLRERGAQLPKLTAYTPSATLPALVVAHQLYGDATRADELVTRNKISHPGFVLGGEALEVLDV